MDSFSFGDEPDSAELIMLEMDMEIPELPPNHKKRRHSSDDFNVGKRIFSLPESSDIRCHSVFRCSKSRTEFSPTGFIGSGEFERFVKNEAPFSLQNEDEIELFGLPATIFSAVEEPDLYENLFLQRLTWLQERSKKAPIFARSAYGNGNDSENFYEIEKVTEEISFFLAVLRLLSYKLVRESSPSEQIDTLVQLLHSFHLQVGLLTDIQPELSFSINSSESSNTNIAPFHIAILTRWTILSCLGYMARSSKVIENVMEDKFLPRFYQLAGTFGWSGDVLIDNHVDVLSKDQLDRLFRQMTFGLVRELTEIAEKRMKNIESSNSGVDFAAVSKRSAFSCSCVREMWLMLHHLYAERPKDFWSYFSTLFEVSNNQKADNKFEKNSLQIQFPYREFSLNLSFWLLLNIAPLSQLSASGNQVQLHEQQQSQSSTPTQTTGSQMFTFLERALKQFQEETSRNFFDEIEIRAYLTVVLSVSKQVKGASLSVTTLHILWEVMHPKLNDSFMGNVTTLEGFATIPHQYTIWLELIEKIISVNVNELSNKTSFELFLCILSDNLSDESSRAVKMTSQFFGRVRSKLPSSKWVGFNERGLFHIISLYLILFKVRNETSSFLQGLCVGLDAINDGHSKRTTIFNGLCAVFVCLVEKCKTNPEIKTRALPQIFAAILTQLEMTLNKGDAVQQFAVVANYSMLLQDPICLDSEILIAQQGIISSFFVKHLEKKVTGTTIKAFNFIVLRLLRYYQEVFSRGTIYLSDPDESKTKSQIDVTCNQIWKLLYPLLKTQLCKNSASTGPFVELAELAYGLSHLSSECLTHMKSLWTNHCSSPAFEQPLIIFRTFGLAHQIHPLVSCNFLRLFIQGELLHVVKPSLIIESWSRVAILLFAHSHFASQDNSVQLEQTSEVVFQLGFFKTLQTCEQVSNLNIFPKLSISENPTAPKQDYFLKVIEVVGVYVRHNPDTIGLIREECDVMLNTFLQLTSTKQDDDNLSIRLIVIGAHFIKHWMGPLLYTDVGMGSINKVGSLLYSTILRREILAESFLLPAKMKAAARLCLPIVFQGLAIFSSVNKKGLEKNHLHKLFEVYLMRFESLESHPIVKIFKANLPGFVDLKQVQTYFYSFVRERLFPEARNTLQMRPRLAHALVLAKHGIAGMMTYDPAVVSRHFENLVINFLPTLFDIYLKMSRDLPQVKTSVSEIIKVVIEFSKTTRKGGISELLLALQGALVSLVEDNMASCIAENMFEILTLFATHDSQLLRHLWPKLDKTVKVIEEKRHSGRSTGSLSTLLARLKEKMK